MHRLQPRLKLSASITTLCGLFLCPCLCLCLCVFSSTAQAQLNGSITAVSDYIYRGVSMTNGKPAWQFNLVYDTPQGWYMGAFTSQVAANNNQTQLRYIAYSGYAHRLPSGLIWELGVNQFLMPADNNNNYSEVYGGLSFERLSAKIHYSPNYLKSNTTNAYLDLAASYPVTNIVDVFAHAGFSKTLSGGIYDSKSIRCDALLGLGMRHAEWNMQLGRTLRCSSKDTISLYSVPFQPATVLSIMRAF